MGRRNHQTAKEWRRLLSLTDEYTSAQKVQINPRTKAKHLVKMLEEKGTKTSLFTLKQVLHAHNLKGHSARKKTLLQTHLKKHPNYDLLLHIGTKILFSGGRCSGLMKQKCNCLSRALLCL